MVFESCLIYPESVCLQQSALACAPTHREQYSIPDFDLDLTWKKNRGLTKRKDCSTSNVGEAVAVDMFYSGKNCCLVIYVGLELKQYHCSVT